MSGRGEGALPPKVEASIFHNNNNVLSFSVVEGRRWEDGGCEMF